MNIIIILFIISSVISIKPKICINCKFCIPDKNTEYSKCSLYKIKNNYELINGIEKIEHYYCTTVRGFDSMCGNKGTMYKKKRIIKEEDIIEKRNIIVLIDIK
jgi:hypothetical protein